MLIVQLRSAQPELDPRVDRFASAFRRCGWESVLVYWRRGETISVAKPREALSVFSTPSSLSSPPFWVIPLLLVAFYLKSLTALVKSRPRVCLAHQLDVLPLALILRGILGEVKVVFDNEDVYSLMVARNSPGLLTAALRSLERTLSSRADLCIFPNEAMRDYVAVKSSSRVLIIPNVPEEEFGQGIRIEPKNARRPIQNFTVAYFGFITQHRGLETLIRAISLASSQTQSVSCLLIGDGPLTDELRRLAEVNGISEKIRFLGRVSRDKIPGFLVSCDASAVLNSRGDPMNWIGNPNKLYESMTLGVPVITSNFGEIARIVDEASCGLLVDPDDPRAIATAITDLSENVDLQNKLSRNGLEAMRTKYSWHRLEASLVEEISRLMFQKTRRMKPNHA